MNPEKSTEKLSIKQEIKRMFEADQADRSGKSNALNNDVWERDTTRLARAREIYDQFRSGTVALSGESLFQLALLFQHSSESGDYLVAKELAEAAAAAGEDYALNLAALAEDRWLLSIGEKQKWGSQFHRGASGEWELLPMQDDTESGITDEMRAARRIPPREQAVSSFLRTIEET